MRYQYTLYMYYTYYKPILIVIKIKYYSINNNLKNKVKI